MLGAPRGPKTWQVILDLVETLVLFKQTPRSQ